jgi:transcriptional regulator GlxA family with amidase domain
VCVGASLLPQPVLLDVRRATTHWKYLASLRRAFPRVRVDDDAIFVQDGRCWTSAGVTAGLDLALALVEADHGRALALAVARGLVFYLKRPGGQSQFSVPLAAQSADAPAIERIRQHVLDSPHADLRVSVLAERAHVSERHLRRLFREALDVSPREFVQRVRLEQAQRLLCESRASVREIARRSGYASADGFARRFEAAFRVSPREYRARFHRDDP